MLIRRELRRYGVDVRSTTQPTYSLTVKDPSDVLIHGMLELLDEYERLTITLRPRRGRLQKARQGGYAGGLPPFGYQAARAPVGSSSPSTLRRPRWCAGCSTCDGPA